MLVFEPFDPRLDPPNPPKFSKILKTENSEKKIKKLKLEDIHIDNNKKNNSRKDLKKSFFYRNSFNENKLIKIKNDKESSDNNNDNALIVRYINSEESDDSNDYDNNKSKKKSRKNSNISESSNSNNSNASDSNSEYKKIKNINPLKKNYSNQKIISRNNNQLGGFHIFSKETIVPENSKNKYMDKNDKDINVLQTLTVDSNEVSPRNPNFHEINKIGISIRPSNISKNNKIKFTEVENIGEKYKNKYISEINSRNSEKEIINNLDITINKKNKTKLIKNRNRKPLKQTLKERNDERKLNIYGSNEGFLSSHSIKKRNNDFKEYNSVIHYSKNRIAINSRKYSLNNESSNREGIKKINSKFKKRKEEKETEKEKEKGLGNMRLKYKRINYAYTPEELNDMDFEEALREDKRNYYRIFISYLLTEHIIFNTFCTDIYLELRPIKLSFLIFGYEINFFLNALFYTDSYISDTYHNDGVLDFFSSLPKSIYSFLVTIVISGLLKMLSNSKKQLNKIIKERQDKTEYLTKMEKELQKFKKKIILYFIIVFILGFLFAYYVSAFCAVYQNSQTFWLIGCLESLALDFVTPFIICLALSILRYIGLKKRRKCPYNSAKYLGVLV